ncbi:MAG TPA: M67 family metallopeptidase [Pyrinomonadaceae bacterium]|nr:M67 family metallopeptidase [Pyrinomonadaceae bacterium]
MLELTRTQRDEIVAQAEREYPHECCGLLLGRMEDGRRKSVVEVFPVSNAREEPARHNRSLITPDEYLRGEGRARERRLDVVGNYHSHPDHPAAPSEFDREHAWPTWSYVIVSVRGGKAEDVRSWELAADRSRFDEEEVSQGGEP